MKKLILNKADFYDSFDEFVKGIEKYGDKPAVSWFTREGEERRVSFLELCLRVSALREALCAHNWTGKHIAIVGENSYDWIVAFLAVTSTGSVAVCIDIEQSDDSLRDMLVRSDVSGIFVSSTYLETIRRLMGETGLPDGLVLMGAHSESEPEETLDNWCTQGEAILAAGSGACADLAVDGQQTAAIFFTSGTTSKPKLVMLSHKNILRNTSDSVRYVSLIRSSFTPLPFYHTYGMTCAVLSILMRGAQLYFNGDLKTMMRDLLLSQADTMLAVPLIVEALYNQMWLAAERAGKADALRKLVRVSAALRKLGIRWQSKLLAAFRKKAVGNLQIIVSGGAHLSAKISEDLEQLGLLVLQGYGITECSPLISANNNCSYRHGTVGHVLDSFEIKFVEDEIWVKGPSVMQGYYKDQAQTDEVMEDGWFKTGDLGYLDKHGFLCLTGRKKNLIVFQNGKKISPEKLEELIRPLPLVKDVIVQGTFNGSSSDDVKLTASIFPDPVQTEGMSSYEILTALQKEIDRINDSLPSYQQIRMLNIREKEFERTSSKKIKRNLV